MLTGMFARGFARAVCRHQIYSRKKRCEWPADSSEGSSCIRCERLGLPCAPQNHLLSRRQRLAAAKRQRKQPKWRAAIGANTLGAMPTPASNAAAKGLSITAADALPATPVLGIVGNMEASDELFSQENLLQGDLLEFSFQDGPSDDFVPADTTFAGEQHTFDQLVDYDIEESDQQTVVKPVIMFPTTVQLPLMPVGALESSTPLSNLPSPPQPLTPNSGTSGSPVAVLDNLTLLYKLPPSPQALMPDSWNGSSTPHVQLVGSLHLSPRRFSIPSDLVLVCVSAYWTHVSTMLIHQLTFESAFSNTPSSIYGPQPPVALLCAVAAIGLRHADVPGLTATDKMRYFRIFSEQAKELLLSGYYSSNSPSMTELEVLQTLVLMHFSFIAHGRAQGAYALLERAADLLKRLCFRPDGSYVWLMQDPTNPSEWVRAESLARMYTFVAAAEPSFAFYANRKPLMDYFAKPFPLPCHEKYFNIPPPEAFWKLCKDPSRPPTASRVMDLSAFPSQNPRSEDLIAPTRRLIGLIFSNQVSGWSFSLFNACFRYLRTLLRNMCIASRINPIRLASQDPEEDTPVEAEYRRKAALLDLVLAEVHKAMPTEVGQPLATGDPQMLFSLSEFYFGPGHRRMSHTIAQNCMAFRSQLIDAWLDTLAAVGQQGSFLAAGPLTEILAANAYITRMTQAALIDDPELHYAAYPGLMACSKVGFFEIILLRMLRDVPSAANVFMLIDQISRDCEVLVMYFETMGVRYPVGESPRCGDNLSRYLTRSPLLFVSKGKSMAVVFRKLMIQAGIFTQSRTPPGITNRIVPLDEIDKGLDVDDDPDSEVVVLPRAAELKLSKMSDIVLAIDGWVKHWLR